MRAITVVTARLGSSRLPGKMLRPLRGRPVLEHVVGRLAAATRTDALVVATTSEAADDPLAEAASALGAAVYRGETEDVLARWLGAGRHFEADLLVCCDGDDVLCDVDHVDRVVECFETTRADYITCTGLPFGTAPTGVSVAGLARVVALKAEDNTEGQGRFFADPSVTVPAQVAAPPERDLPVARMTLDYPEDLEFFERLIEELEPEGSRASPQRVVDVLRTRPDLVAINAGRQAEYWARFNAKYKPVELRSG